MILLSVRPRFADALLSGSKTVEIRRRRARIAEGALCLLYASSPTCALVGAIRVAFTEVASPDALWTRHGHAMGLDRREYDAYLAGAAHPCAIVVAGATTFTDRIRLPELRRRGGSFVIPQSYRHVRDSELTALLNGQLGEIDALDPPRVLRPATSCTVPRASGRDRADGQLPTVVSAASTERSQEPLFVACTDVSPGATFRPRSRPSST
jgi:predicted transcriptional regulator